MRRHWRVGVWVLLWLVPLPLMPDVMPVYWPTLLLPAGWAFRVGLVFEPSWSIDDELSEIESWLT